MRISEKRRMGTVCEQPGLKALRTKVEKKTKQKVSMGAIVSNIRKRYARKSVSAGDRKFRA